MAQEFSFDGRTIVNPGVYTALRARPEFTPTLVGSAKALIVDQGKGALFGSGSGIRGKRSGGGEAIYSFTRASDFQEFVGGGPHWALASQLFSPTPGVPGISELVFVRACSTTPSGISISTGEANADINTVDEGFATRGVTNLPRAHATVFLSIANDITLPAKTVYSITLTQGTDQSVVLGSVTSGDADTQMTVSNRLIKDLRDRGLSDVVVTAPTAVTGVDPSKRVVLTLPVWIDTAKATQTGAEVKLEITNGTGVEGIFVTSPADATRLNAMSTLTFTAQDPDDPSANPAPNLLRGYSMQITHGDVQGTFIFTFYRGVYRGTSHGLQPTSVTPFELSAPANETRQEVIARSPALNTWQAFRDWADGDRDFTNFFRLDALNYSGVGLFVGGGNLTRFSEPRYWIARSWRHGTYLRHNKCVIYRQLRQTYII